ncbi:VIT1/CCC1 transporter family protein [Flavihumibacter solisilvae]|uniref:VIT1/CCC1 transporter family protein n=1 Tax=Flavihumibacter solisilvae TaxID=1349421 RepID=UPI00068E36E3|nr:VIT1/CCC1 transporter family protein [Flavihumibacter solisilvae]
MTDQIFWKNRVKENAVLNPIDRTSEVLFGLIMVLTFTGAISAASDGRSEVRELLWAALGCNVAWGLVDAIMYLMNIVLERGHSLVIIKKIMRSGSQADSREILKEEINPLVSSLMTEDELDQLNDRLKQLPVPSVRNLLTLKDLGTGVEIFLLVFLCTLPVALPFALHHDIASAMRISNGVALVMLFIGGFILAGYAGFSRLLTALLFMTIGVLLVALTMSLGG